MTENFANPVLPAASRNSRRSHGLATGFTTLLAGLLLLISMTAPIAPASEAHTPANPDAQPAATKPADTTPDEEPNSMAPELTPNDGWLNTDRPLRFSDELKGHIVVLDFWTYCCINCIHVAAELETLERKFKDEPVVFIGVHSAKFVNESERRSIRQAVERYEIRHPVVVDHDMRIWRAYGAQGWPTLVVIDSRGRYVGHVSGEGNAPIIDETVTRLLAEGKAKGTLAAKRVDIPRDAEVPALSGLRFPGKVLAVAPDAASGKPGFLFISDSTNNRVIQARWPDASGHSEVLSAFGGLAGFADGSARDAQFHDPQGLAYARDTNMLFVADRKNHAIRAIDLQAQRVTTLAGKGFRGIDREGGRAGTAQELASPWDLALSHDGGTLAVAMAGTHQLWTVDLRTGVATRLAGSGAEDLRDGPAPDASLAQPSGLSFSADGSTLYFVDSETSSVRAFDLPTNAVRTIIGKGLFDFGDVDGSADKARLQHCLGIAVMPASSEGKGEPSLLVADTYNHKLKLVNPRTRESSAWAGSRGAGVGETGDSLGLDEPGGLSIAGNTAFIADTNNHRIVAIDLTTKRSREIMFTGLSDPDEAAAEPPKDIIKLDLAAAIGKPITFDVAATLPAGTKINTEAPMTVRVSGMAPNGIVRTAASATTRQTTFPLSVTLPAEFVVQDRTVLVELSYAACRDGTNAICIPGSAAWQIRFTPGDRERFELATPAAKP